MFRLYFQFFGGPKTLILLYCSYPLDLKLDAQSDQISVVFGQRDGIKVGHVVMSVNGRPVIGRKFDDGTDVMEVCTVFNDVVKL